MTKLNITPTRFSLYAVNNAILKVLNNVWQLDKARNSNRIDPIAALINAFVAGMDYYQESEDQQHAEDYYKTATAADLFWLCTNDLVGDWLNMLSDWFWLLDQLASGANIGWYSHDSAGLAN